MNVRLRRFYVDQYNGLSSSFDLDDDEQVIAVEWDREVAVVTTIRPWHSPEYVAQLAAEAAGP